MTEETQTQQETEQTQVENTPEPTIEDIAREFKVEENTQEVQQEVPPQQTQQTQPQIPEPYDPEFRNWATQVSQGQNALAQVLPQVVARLNQYERQQHEQKVRADINTAVTKVKDHLGDSLKLSPKAIEGLLDGRAREDRSFKAIWDARDKNPKAYEKALEVVAKDIHKMYDIRVDPALAEAQRARRSAQNATKATQEQEGSGNPLEDRLAKAENFDAEWSRVKNQTY